MFSPWNLSTLWLHYKLSFIQWNTGTTEVCILMISNSNSNNIVPSIQWHSEQQSEPILINYSLIRSSRCLNSFLECLIRKIVTLWSWSHQILVITMTDRCTETQRRRRQIHTHAHNTHRKPHRAPNGHQSVEIKVLHTSKDSSSEKNPSNKCIDLKCCQCAVEFAFVNLPFRKLRYWLKMYISIKGHFRYQIKFPNGIKTLRTSH